MQPLFFKPDTDFVKWLINYAGDRTIIDVGAGEKFILSQMIINNGGRKVVAIDPFIDFSEYMLWKTKNIHLAAYVSFHVLAKEIEELTALYKEGTGQKCIIVFARPCHSAFVSNVLSLKGSDVEVLYITKPVNFKKYSDLGSFKTKAKIVKHKGTSIDKEVVYSIK